MAVLRSRPREIISDLCFESHDTCEQDLACVAGGPAGCVCLQGKETFCNFRLKALASSPSKFV